jgi:hypothetical protein
VSLYCPITIDAKDRAIEYLPDEIELYPGDVERNPIDEE